MSPDGSCLWKCLSCDEDRKGMSVCACVRVHLCWGLLSENEMSLPTLSTAAPGLSLCDANCFCYSCQVPTLPQHILQTGPSPSAAFCVCLRSESLEKKKKNAKQKDVLAICNYCATAPRLRHISTQCLRTVGGTKKTKLTSTTANNTQNNSRGSCFDLKVKSREDRRRYELSAFVRHYNL